MKVVHVPFKRVSDYTLEDFGGKRGDNTVCIVRYGAFGDIIQASSLFPKFKEQGYKVCVNVSESGHSLLKNNPYVDQLIVQKTDQCLSASISSFSCLNLLKEISCLLPKELCRLMGSRIPPKGVKSTTGLRRRYTRSVTKII